MLVMEGYVGSFREGLGAGAADIWHTTCPLKVT
jgi:hypothetical protein